MLAVLIWTGWIYLGGLLFFSIPIGAALIFRATLTPERRDELDTVVPGAVYLATLGWPLNLALVLYIRVEAAKRRRE